LAEDGDANTTQAAAYAVQARDLVTGAEQAGGWHSPLMARLIETCADDTLRFAGQAGSTVPLSGDTR
jgi:hypothetical protein